MKTRATVILGVCFCIVGLALIITAHTGSTWQKATVEDLNFEFIYPSGWTKTQKWETLSYPATDEQPASSIDHFVIDLLDRGNTIHIRINFFRTDAPTSGQQVAEAISKVNARNKDYRLLELKDVIVGGQAAVRKVETYQISNEEGPVLWTLVSTYVSDENGFYSILLLNSPWPDIPAHMEIYEKVVESFHIIH